MCIRDSALHVPSTGFVHCLYVFDAASYMHAFAGVHAGPKLSLIHI